MPVWKKTLIEGVFKYTNAGYDMANYETAKIYYFEDYCRTCTEKGVRNYMGCRDGVPEWAFFLNGVEPEKGQSIKLEMMVTIWGRRWIYWWTPSSFVLDRDNRWEMIDGL